LQAFLHIVSHERESPPDHDRMSVACHHLTKFGQTAQAWQKSDDRKHLKLPIKTGRCRREDVPTCSTISKHLRWQLPEEIRQKHNISSDKKVEETHLTISFKHLKTELPITLIEQPILEKWQVQM